MTKNTAKITAKTIAKITGLVAGLVLLICLPALADEWKEQGGHWYCYDASGRMYRGVQRKDGISYYYLDDETGAMVTDKVIEIDGAKYYFGADGARVVSSWQRVSVENETDGYEYMYFRSNGKAATGGLSLRMSGGSVKRYQFDEDGYMLYGYLTETYEKVGYPSAATYYYGNKEEGFRYTGWVNITDGSDEMNTQAESLWFYFGSNGKKVEGKSQYRVSSGNRYTFEAETGKMVTGWARNTSNEAPVNTTSALEYRYYGKINDGAMKKDEWVSTQAFNEEHDSRYYWYYLDTRGEIVNGTELSGEAYAAAGNRSSVAKIHKKYYCFNEEGRMQTGFQFGTTDDVNDPTRFIVDEAVTEAARGSASAYKGRAIHNASGERTYYIRFFSEETEDEGVMKTEATTVTLEGSEFKVYLDKHGIAYEGVVDRKIYNNGILQTAGSVIVCNATCNAPSEIDGVAYSAKKMFLINKTGTILFRTKMKDSDNRYWAATANACGPDDEYTVYKMADKENASAVAEAIRKTKRSDWEVNETGTMKNYGYVLKEKLQVAGKTYQVFAKITSLGSQVRDVNWIVAE